MFDKKTFPIDKILLAAFVACVVALNYFTPMHSDDYSYKMMGHDWQAHLGHYMGWSGRLVADYISPTLLIIDNKLILALIQTTGFFLLAHVIARSTRFVRSGADMPHSDSWLTLFVAALIFLSLPVFGQVALWVVGSANYLWTAVLYSSFIYFVLKYVYTGEVPWYAWPVALLAGCTNESASATILAFSGLTFLWLLWKQRRVDYRFLILLVCFAVGAAVLVGAPGNQARMADSYFQEWLQLSFAERMELHFTQRIVRPFEQSSFSYLLALILLVVALRDKKPFFTMSGRPAAKALFIIFFAMAVFAMSVMALAPTMPPRSLTIPFVFLMFSLVFGVVMLAERSGWVRRFRRYTLFLCGVSALYLVLLLPAYESLHQQEKIRLALIEQAGSEDAVHLPDFHMRTVPVKNSRMYLIDGHKSPGTMARYYGVKTITIEEAGFDYSVITDQPDHNSPRAWSYSESPWQTTFVVEHTTPESGQYQLNVTTLLNDDTQVCLEKNTRIGSSGFSYTTISVPAFAIKAYSLEPQCDASR